MNTFQKAIAGLFKIPTAKPRQRGYAGGRGNGAGLSGWIAPQASADNDLWSALRTLIARSRSLYNDDSNVQAAVDELVATVVDDGLKLQSHVGRRRGKGLDLAVNQRIEDAFNAWANNPDWCDVAGLHTFWQMQRIVQHNRLVDGGILIRCVKRRFSDSPVPFALELIDVDLLDDRTALINSRKNDIRMGIEVDGWRRPVAYWLFDGHPQDLWGTPGQSYYSRPVSASEIIHVFNRQGWRAGQTRGVPALHAAILKARNLLGFEESEIVKARVQSCITAFVESEFSDTEQFVEDDDGYALRELFPGAVEYLSPGQKLAAFDPSSPNPNAPAFIKHFQRAIARVLGMSSYSVTGDLNDANYSSLREGTLKEWRRIRIMRDELSADFLHPIFVRWLDAAVLSGALSLPQDYEGNRARYLKDNWFGRPMPWFDPTKDTNAIAKEIELGLTTQTEVLAERGKDINDVLATRAQEKEMMKSYGLDESEMGEDGKKPQPEPEENAPLMEGMQAVRFLSEALERSYKVIHGDRQLPQPETVTAEFVEPAPTPDIATPTEEEDLTTINLNFNGFPFDMDGMDGVTGMNGDRALPEPIEDFPLLRGFTDAHPFRDRKIKPRKKKNCSQGHQCGFSCVAKGKVCKADMTTAQLKAHNAAKRAERKAAKAAKGGGSSQSTNESQQGKPALVKRFDDPALKKFFGGNGYRIDSAEVKVSKGDPVSIDSMFVERSLSELFFDKVAGKDYPAIDVSYDIDGAYDYTQRRLSDKEKIRVGRKAFSMMRDAGKELPDGTILITAAYTDDGKGDYRARIYQKAGFGEANKRGTQFGIVVGGKIQPVTESELLKQVEES